MGGVFFFFQFLLSWTMKCRSAHLAPPLCVWHTSDHATDSRLRRQLWSSSPSSSSPKKQTKKLAEWRSSKNGSLGWWVSPERCRDSANEKPRQNSTRGSGKRCGHFISKMFLFPSGQWAFALDDQEHTGLLRCRLRRAPCCYMNANWENSASFCTCLSFIFFPVSIFF